MQLDTKGSIALGFKRFLKQQIEDILNHYDECGTKMEKAEMKGNKK